jgi:glyoxylase-like metal-dependent hydrolase (beta-lactamase superfamily II)
MLIKPFPEIENIHAIVIPLPGFGDLITSNVFVVGNGPVTLIDTAPKFPGSFESVRKQLGVFGFNFSDVERIIITHGHIDHFGLAERIAQAAGHEVACFIHEEDLWRTTREYMERGMWSEEAQDFAALVDMPSEDVARMRRRSAFFKNFCDPLENVNIMHHGDVFTGDGYELCVYHTPGHSVGSCCILETEKNVLFSGDHIIKHITPNPFHEIHRTQLKDSTYQSLKAYDASLDTVSNLDIRYVYPGHGEYIDDLEKIISGYRKHHQQRKDNIYRAIKNNPRAVYHLVEEIFPPIPESEIFLAVSEIYVHLEILMNEEKAECADPGPPALYRAL